MMIHMLPTPIRGATHIRLDPSYVGEDRISLSGQLGTVVEGVFKPDPYLASLVRNIGPAEFVQMLAWVAEQNAPVVGGVQSYRNTDVLVWLDNHGGWETPA